MEAEAGRGGGGSTKSPVGDGDRLVRARLMDDDAAAAAADDDDDADDDE